MLRFVTALLALVMLVSPLAASAHEIKVGDLVIHHPWARATPKGAKVAGGYLVIANNGNAPDRLIGVSAEFADMAMLHSMSTENGISSMRHVDGIDIPAGGTVELKPGGLHIMFMGLNAQLMEDMVFKGELVFEKAGKVPVEFMVESLGAMGGAEGADHDEHAE